MNKNTVSINEAITAGADPAKLGVTMVKVTKPSMMEETLWSEAMRSSRSTSPTR